MRVNMVDIKTLREHIVKLGNNKYRLLSHKGKNLGTFNSHAAAAKHEGEVEFFKHHEAKEHMPNNVQIPQRALITQEDEPKSKEEDKNKDRSVPVVEPNELQELEQLPEGRLTFKQFAKKK